MAPDRGNFVGILGSCFILIQLAWLDYPVVRNYDKAVSTIPERVGQTDRQNCYINIVRQYADAW